MILTITLNPAVDLTLTVEGWEIGEVNRAIAVNKAPGGKGINVSRVLKELSHPTTALTIIGSDSVTEFQRLARQGGFTIVYINRPGEIRVNVHIQDTITGKILKVNQPGMPISKTHFDHFVLLFKQQLKTAKFVALGGSLPPGLETDTYRRLVALARNDGIPTMLDAEGEPLIEALQERPTIAKPNRRELENTFGRSLDTPKAIIEASRSLLRMGAQSAVVTDGADAIYVLRESAGWVITPPKIEVRSSTGAGDSFAAGLAYRLVEGDSFERAVAFATAAGAACCLTGDGELAEAKTIRRLLPEVRVQPISSALQ